MSSSVNAIQYMAISALSYNDFDSLVQPNPDTGNPWTIHELIAANKIDGISYDQIANSYMVTKPELEGLLSIQDWTFVNAESNTTLGFAGVAVQMPPSGSTPGEVVFGFRGTEVTLADLYTDAQIALPNNPLGSVNQYDDAFTFFENSLNLLGSGNYTGYSFTGWSLGGGIAQYMTYMTNNNGDAVTFNAVGIGQDTMFDNVSNLSSYNVTDYVNENDIIGNYGEQLGTTVYLHDGVNDDSPAAAIRDAAVWYGIVAALSSGLIGQPVAAALFATYGASLTTESHAIIENLIGLQSHALSALSESIQNNDTVSSSNVSEITAGLSLLGAGGTIVANGIEYAIIFQETKLKVGVAVVSGVAHLLISVDNALTDFFYNIGATATEVAYQLSDTIDKLGDQAANALWLVWSAATLSTHTETGTSSGDTLTGWNDKNNILDGLAGDDTITGQNLDDMLRGGDGNDTINANSGNDFIYGEAGNDTLTGGAANDTLFGGSGDDTIYGDDDSVKSYAYGGYLGIGNDSLDGGAGNDILKGDGGDDTYYFGKGYGQDTIRDELKAGYSYSWSFVDGGFDTVKFRSGVDPSEVKVVRQGGNLVFQILGTTDTLTVQGFFDRTNNNLYSAIEQVVFSDNNHTVWILNDLLEKARHIDGTSGDDNITGFSDQNDIILAGDGNDTVHAAAGDDYIEAGNGNDTVYGESSGDTIIGGAGDDTLYGDDDSAKSYAYGGYYGIGNDTLDGGAGNDVLYGDGGNDTYIFGRGYGQDIIQDHMRGGDWYSWSYVDAGFDTISFLEGINPEDVTVVRQNSDLIFQISGSTDTLTVQNYFYRDPNTGSLFDAIEQVQFNDANQTTWTKADLLEKARHINGTSSADNLIGYDYQSDIIVAGDGNDTINGYGDDDVISAGNGNDTAYGGNGNDTLSGDAGDDTLYGDDGSLLTYQYGNDTLDGGAGNDILYGQGGNDTYIFGLGYGQDTINDSLNGGYYYSQYPLNAGFDTISFLEGIEPEDVEVVRNGNDLQFKITGTTDSITVQNFFIKDSSGVYVSAVEKVQFDDTNATTWSFSDLLEKARYINGTSGDDYINGFDDQADVVTAGAGNDTINTFGGNDTINAGDGNDTISGGNGSDTINGGAGNDTIYGDDQYYYSGASGTDTITGGAGNDTLFGGGGNDTYVFSVGDGQDTINDIGPYDNWNGYNNGGFDTVSFTSEVDPSDVEVVRSGNDLLLKITGTTDSITVQNFFTKNSSGVYIYAIEQVQFADANNTVWNQADLLEKARHLNGTSGDDSLYGFDDQSDVVVGGAGNDTIATYGGNDTIDGGEGNDTLSGGQGNDYVAGGIGDDTIYGDDSYYNSSAAGADTIVGGAGNDTLYGKGGNDTYVFSLGDGQDVINDVAYDNWNGYTNGGYDTISYTSDVSPNDVEALRSGNDLILKISGTSDSVTVQNFFQKDGSGNYIYAIEQVQFADANNTVWTQADILEKVRHINGTSGDDYIYGADDQADIVIAGNGNDTVYTYGGNDSIDAGAGNDTIYGGNGNDTLTGGDGNDVVYGDDSYYSSLAGSDTITGGAGDDTLYGGGGNDTYIFSLGDGHDVINDSVYDNWNGYTNGGYDTISLGAGIDPEDIQVTRSGNDLLMSITGTSDSITMQNFFTKNGSGTYVSAIEQIQFADANQTTWDLATLLDKGRYINGTSGVDYLGGYGDQINILSGEAGDDYLYGGGLGDTLIGGTGNDHLNGGNGNNTYLISAGDGVDIINDTAGNDLVDFGYDLSDIVFSQSGNDLQLTVAGATDALTISSWYSNSSNQIETFKASDGSTISNTQIGQLIQAMATYSSNNNGISWNDALTNNPQDVQSILSQYWTAPSA